MPSIVYIKIENPVQTIFTKTPSYHLGELRQLFEPAQAGITYLNHAGMSPLPRPVREAMHNAVETMAHEGSGAYSSLLEPLLPELRKKLGRLVGCTEAEIAFVESTSYGLNVIAQSLPLRQGDNILICDREFPSNVYPYQNLRSKGVQTRLIPTDNGGLSLDEVDKHRDSQTRVIAVSALQFFSGKREPTSEIGTYCKEQGLWLIVDAMQAAGIVPIDMEQMGIHALAAGGQKSLLGPPGQGFIAIASELLEQMTPIFAGPVSVVNWDKWLSYDLVFLPNARRFDMGTYNIAGIAGLDAAVSLLLRLDPKNIIDWVTYLSNIAIHDLQTRGFRVVTPASPQDHAHIVTFAVKGNSADLVNHLEQNGIILRAHDDVLGNPHLRISSHAYNTVEDVLRVGKVLGEISYE